MTVSLDTVLARLAKHKPSTISVNGLQAATALILTAEDEPRFALIRRSTHDGDPWSGHSALPGGKVDPEDAGPAATARREAFEEVGIELGEPVGRLDDIGGRLMKGVVTPMVFHVPEAVPLKPDPREAAAAHWVPLSIITDRTHRVRYPHHKLGPWPAWNFITGEPAPFDSLIIWGLTYRILTSFRDVALK